MTILKHSEGKTKGQKRGNTGLEFWKYSSIWFEPNPEPDEFEDKLKKLLSFLEQDKNGIKTLVDQANGYIQISYRIS